MPYTKRARIDLDVDVTETLGAVVDAAANVLGISPGPRSDHRRVSQMIEGVAFYKPEDEGGVERPEPWST